MWSRQVLSLNQIANRSFAARNQEAASLPAASTKFNRKNCRLPVCKVGRVTPCAPGFPGLRERRAGD